MVNGPVPAQLVGVAMLVVGGTWLWGPLFLIVAGALLIAGPEVARFGPGLPVALTRLVIWARVDVPRALAVARGVQR